MSLFRRAAATAALLLASATAGAALMPVNIVLNPGFELGALHWKYMHFLFMPQPLWAHTEPRVARLTYCDHDNCLDKLNKGAYFSQVLNTAPGQLYDLSFWVRSFAGESRFSVFWDGMLLTATGTPNGPMQQYTFTGLAASGAGTQLQVHGYNSIHQHMSFDDFSVVLHSPPVIPQEPQAVSEPGMYALILLALGGMALAMRRPIV